MNKITVKEFVEGYNMCVDSLKKKIYTGEARNYILFTCKTLKTLLQ